MHNKPKYFTAMAVLLAFAAQSKPAMAGDEIATEDSVKADQVKTLTNPSTTSSGGQLKAAARLAASQDDSSAQITLTLNGEGEGSKANSSLAVTLTAPLSKKTKRADFLTVDGLPSELSLGFSFNQSFVNLDVEDVANSMRKKRSALLDKATSACMIAKGNQTLATDARLTKCRDVSLADAGEYLEAVDVKELNRIGNNEYEAMMRRSYFLLGATGSVGTQKFEFFDASTLGGQSQRKVSYTAGAWFGFLPQLKSHVFLIAGFEAKKSYKDADEATYCPTGTITPTVKCTTGPFGPPQKEIDTKIATKARFSFGSSFPIGIEVAAAYDFYDKSWGVELPVYLLTDKDDGLIGGLRGAYDSKKDDFQFGIFVGKKFDFLNFSN